MWKCQINPFLPKLLWSWCFITTIWKPDQGNGSRPVCCANPLWPLPLWVVYPLALPQPSQCPSALVSCLASIRRVTTDTSPLPHTHPHICIPCVCLPVFLGHSFPFYSQPGAKTDLMWSFGMQEKMLELSFSNLTVYTCLGLLFISECWEYFDLVEFASL